MQTKVCNKCRIEKDIEQFSIYKRKMANQVYKNYIRIYCKKCQAQDKANWRKNNPEKVKLQNKTERALNSKKKWLKNNKEKRKQYEKEYYLKNIEKYKEVSKTSKVKERKKIYKRNRMHNDPIFRIRNNISNAIFKALKKGKSNKAGNSILKYLNYTIIDLKYYLQNQFDNKMDWNNYGIYWHIDHIIPQSDLPYNSMEDNNFKICWSLNNLRPLEAKQNIIDGATRIRHKKT